MTKDELAGFVMTTESAEKYFMRVMEAEKKLGKLSLEERENSDPEITRLSHHF